MIWRLARVKQSLQYYCSRSTSPRSVSSIWKPFVIVVSPQLASLWSKIKRSGAQECCQSNNQALTVGQGKWLDLCVAIQKLDTFTWTQGRLHSKICLMVLYFCISQWETSFLHILFSWDVFTWVLCFQVNCKKKERERENEKQDRIYILG